VPSDFRTLARTGDVQLDALALALAAEFRTVDGASALAELDRLGAALGELPLASPLEQAHSLRTLLSDVEGFAGDQSDYDNPDNSMLDVVLERRRGLPILLTAVYVEVARRAGVAVAGVGLPGHFLAGIFAGETTLLVDPFSGGRLVVPDVEPEAVRPWGVKETALRMLNNLVGSYTRRADLARAITAAELRLALPLDGRTQTAFEIELRSLRARLN
jgi:regulator of sirC expression with transglutaminase-like and TPR domain